jgi:hypothetical protein
MSGVSHFDLTMSVNIRRRCAVRSPGTREALQSARQLTAFEAVADHPGMLEPGALDSAALHS